MSDKLNTYSFLPWVREGIANRIGTNPAAADKLRATFELKIKVTGSVDETVKTISLYGPGDITGIDSKAIIKTDPLNWITNFEPNYLPCIDFYDEDFPWRYSPDIPDSGKRLQPWLALVVLEESIFEDGKDMTGKPLPYICLKDKNAKELFQPSDQLWAWAHVHVNRDLLDGTTNTGDANSVTDVVRSDDDNIPESVINAYSDTLKENPDLAYSRIMCPLKLKENSAYYAFLIPAFESGRLAGLGKDVESIFKDSTFKPATPAWATTTEIGNDPRSDAMQFPVYYRWYFRTGNVGDFEYLVRLLEPKLIDSRVGTRDMNVTNPGSNVEGIGDTETKPDGTLYSSLDGILRLGGALKIPEIAIENKEEYYKYENWDQPSPRLFQTQLAAFVNLADDYSENSTRESHKNENLPEQIQDTVPEEVTDPDPDPLITPPIYGCWHSLSKKLLEPDENNPVTNWVHKINLDPRHRVTAGFGTKIIQKNQENYMESAWQQVGDIMEANRRIRQAQLAHFAARRWYSKNLANLYASNNGAFINITQPVHSRVVSESVTTDGKKTLISVNHQIKTSKVPSIVFSHDMRKFTRSGGRLVKYLKFDAVKNPVEKLAERINNDEVIPAPPKIAPGTISTVQDFSEALKPAKVPGFFLKWIEKMHWLEYLVLGLALAIIVLLAIFVGPNFKTITPGFGSLSGFAMLLAILLSYLYYYIIKLRKTLKYSEKVKEENQTPESIEALPKKPGFKLTVTGEKTGFEKGNSDSKEAASFKKALLDSGELIQSHLDASAPKVSPKLNFTAISKALFTKLDPDKSIPDYILKTQVKIPDRLSGNMRGESFKEVMVYPELDIPMYKPLIDISADLFLPNINYVSQNSISLLETNQPFIEAYMVGVNHEFSRELLWREFPTDQRGSYFRQFWDVSDFMYDKDDLTKLNGIVRTKYPDITDEDELNKKLEEEIRESLKDIPPIHKWNRKPTDKDPEAHFLGKHDHRENYKKTKMEQISGGASATNNKNENELVLVIRGELLKKYPNAVIYAHRARWQPTVTDGIVADKSKERVLFPVPDDMENPLRTDVKTPLYEAKAEPDIYFFGFDLTAEVAMGLTEGEPTDLDDRAGWFFVIKERPGEPRFGLDVDSDDPGKIQVWNDLSWEAIKPIVSNEGYINMNNDLWSKTVTKPAPNGPDVEKLPQYNDDIQISWNKGMNSAEIAYILYQAPVMMAVHAVEMLKPK